MTPFQLRRRTELVDRNYAALDRWPDPSNADFKQEVEAVAEALVELASEADATAGDRLERSRTWRYAGNAFFDLFAGGSGTALEQASRAYRNAEALLAGLNEPEDQRKLDYCLGRTLVGLSRGKDLSMAREAKKRLQRSLAAARRIQPEAVSSAQAALSRAEKLVLVLEEVDRLSFDIDSMEEQLRLRDAPPNADDRSMTDLVDVLKGMVDTEKQKGTIDKFQHSGLQQLLGELNDVVQSASAPVLSDIVIAGEKTAGFLNRLRPMIIDSVFEKASGRAARVLRYVQQLKDYVVVDSMRPGNLPGEGDKRTNLLMRLSQLAKAITEAKDGELPRLEREQVRPLAHELRLFARRRHLTLARPVWGGGEPATDPNLVFFSGPLRIRSVVAPAAELLGLEVSPASYPGVTGAGARWHDLAAAAVAVFDLSQRDPQRFYELGIALTVGVNLLLLATNRSTVPFDVAHDIYRYSRLRDLQQLLPEALDAATYSIQTNPSRSSLQESVVQLERIVRDESGTPELTNALDHIRELTSDPVRVRAALHLVNKHIQTPIVPLYPRWPSVYPDPGRPSCFVVMPFRRKLNPVYQQIANICKDAGVDPVRGDLAEGQDIVSSIWDEIGRARFVIIDITGLNLNVCLELGIADALGKPSLLIGRLGTEKSLFPSIAKRRCHTYGPEELGRPLRRRLESFLVIPTTAARAARTR